MPLLWETADPAAWREALARYPAVVEAQGVGSLPALDAWVRRDLPARIAERSPAHVTLDELARLTRWKMARGVWRARNLALVEGNAPEAVVKASAEALAAIPDPRRPIARLAELAGVGPATASAVAAAAAPDRYPFLDELVAARVPGLGPAAFTLPFYLRYAAALGARGTVLGLTPAEVERALWSDAGGKAGAVPAA
jgi:hypothetical protein